MKKNILVLDDVLNIRQDLSRNLKKRGYEVFTAGTIEEANRIIQLEKIDFAIIDLKIDYTSDWGGIKIIENINKLQPEAKTIVLSAFLHDPEIIEQLSKLTVIGFISKGGQQNYIRAVIMEIANIITNPPEKKCFVIMPFSATKSCKKDEWTDIFEYMIEPAVMESGFSYRCCRAHLGIGNIIKDVLDNLNKADIVIADLTDQNPNVFYELGVRHALRNATILIAQDKKYIPFDLMQYMTLIYDWKTNKGKEEFKKQIKEAFTQIERDPDNPNIMSPVREYLKL